MTICIQCALEAFVKTGTDLANLQTAATFDETPEEHQARCHPDLEATRKRRRALEALFAQRMGGAMLYPDPADNH